MKKAMEISLGTLIIAIICLVVLFVIIAIFTGTIGDIANKFRGGVDKAGKTSDSAFDDIDMFKCEDGKIECRGKDLYKCINGKFEIEKKCDNGCKDKACT